MTTANLDISTSRVGADRIKISHRSVTMISTSPSKQAEREKIAADMAKFSGRVTVIPTPAPRPYLQSTRKRDPDIALRHAKRAKQFKRAHKAPEGMYGNTEVMALHGYDTVAYGYRRFAEALERGDIPSPDETRSAGEGKFFRFWWKGKIDKHLAEKQSSVAGKNS